MGLKRRAFARLRGIMVMANDLTKMSGASKDVLSVRVDELRKLIPEAFADGKVDFEALRAALGAAVDTSKEHYRFVWNGKNESRAFAFTPSMGTLRPCKEESKHWDTTKNLYIEGDNLEVLKLLQGSYYRAVKLIYIDPPYNTGHDFVYPDNYKDSIENYKEKTGQTDSEGHALRANPETSGRYHTDWLNMMFPRLLIARNLLRDDGVIFISIDDNEETNLRKLCDEVFGENNFLGMIVLKTATDNNGSQVTTEHEYLLCFAKSASSQGEWNRRSEAALKIKEQFIKLKKKKLSNEDIQVALRKWIKENKNDLPQVSHYNNVDDKGVYSSSSNSSNPHPGGYMYDILHPITGKPCPKPANGWRWPEATFWGYANDGEIEWGEDETTQPHVKKRIETAMESLRSLIYEDNRGTTKELASLFDGKKVFDNPKPHSVISRIIDFVSTKDSLILDFFSGSATTAHAVMQLNAKDGGSRRFIMAQLPQLCAEDSEAAKAGYKNICEIGKERIRRAGEKIKEANATVAPNLDIGFKVFKLDTSNLIPWNPNPENLEKDLLAVVDNAVEGRTADDLLYEILLKCNLPLTLPIDERKIGGNTISVIGGGKLMVCLDKHIPLAVAEEMVRLRAEEFKSEAGMQVVFLDNGFVADKDKANAIMVLKQGGVEEKAIMSI